VLVEPVRGGFPDRSFHGRAGLDRARAYLRGAVPRPPLSHLFGYRVTQVGLGTATLTMPVSPWFQTLDEQMFGAADVLVEEALAMAALTGAPPGSSVRVISMSTSRFRPVTLETAVLVARARTLNTGRTLNFLEVQMQDSAGRQVLHAIGAAVHRPLLTAAEAASRPDEELAPIDAPSYPTPDPYLRPLPEGVGTIPRRLWDEHDGPEIARMYSAGELPRMPLAALLGLRLENWEEGRLDGSIDASEWLSSEERVVSRAVLALILHAALGSTTAVKLAMRRAQVGIADDTMSFYRDVPCDGRPLKIGGRITHRPSNFVVSDAEIADADGNLVAAGHRTSVFLEPRPQTPAATERRLLTVVFTDIVNSTGRATELGDERWSRLLGEHDRIVRQQLEHHGGREVKTTGDGFLVTFDSPTLAMRCATAIRSAVRALGLQVRAGIHTGDCEIGGGDVAGVAVHVAARLQAAAQPDEILVSNVVRELAAGSGLPLINRGERELKGLEGSWTLFAVDP